MMITRLLAVALLASVSTSFGGPPPTETKVPPVDNPPWQVDFNLGLAVTQGNTDTFGLNIGLNAEKKWDGWQFLGKASYTYTEDNDVTTGNAFRLDLQLNRDLTERWYVGVVNGFSYDEIADLDYREQLGLLVGYRLWKSDRGELAVEAGPGYTWEKQGGITDDYFNARFAERFRFNLSENSRFIQSLAYLPDISDFGRYTLVAEVALTTRIAGNLWWRIGVRDIYNSEPPVGLKENDLQLISGITWGLGDPEKAGPKKIRKRSDVTKPTAAPSRPEGVWQSTAAIGFSMMKGNSDNLLLTGDINTSMLSKPNEYAFSLGGAYGETEGARTVDNIRAAAQYNRLLKSPFYVGAALTYLTDKIADLDYRITPAIVLGVKVIDTDRVSLRLEGGPGYTWEKQGGITDDYFTLVARERLEVAISSTAKFWQSLTNQFDVSDTSNYVLTAELGVDFWLTENISLRTVASNTYDNQPALGSKENDFRLTSGIAVAF